MKSITKKILWVVVIIAALLIGYVGYFLHQAGPIGTGYTAKVLCSSVFVSDRNPNAVLNEDLAITKGYMVGAKVNREDKSVTASLLGLFKRKAIFRKGLGCTLVVDFPEDQIRKQSKEYSPPPSHISKDSPWPTGDLVSGEDLPPGIDMEKIGKALDEAFSEPDPDMPQRTRAVVVVYDGHIVAERYAPGFSKDTPLLGWSMTKSILNALAGILVGEGKLSVNDPAPVPEWKSPGDPRAEITLDQLLHMTSGLKFVEEYEENIDSDCNVMLFENGDMAAFAASKNLEAEPGTKWYYSSGTANIISRIIRHTVGDTKADYLGFPRRALFDKIGMSSAIIEPEASGTFVGSSYMYATARDWARFGLLYLNDGIWEGERILPEGWVAYTRRPTPGGLEYGALFWLNTDGKIMPWLPHDTYCPWGHQGQFVIIIPSRNIVVVRLGLTDSSDTAKVLTFITTVLEAIPEGKPHL